MSITPCMLHVLVSLVQVTMNDKRFKLWNLFLLNFLSPRRAQIPRTRETKFYRMVSNIFSTIAVPFHTYKNMYQFTCTEQKAPDTTEIPRSSQNFVFWVRNCLHVTLKTSRNWRELLDILKMLWMPDLATCYSPSLLRPFNLLSTSL
jgi:hypothetical protein